MGRTKNTTATFRAKATDALATRFHTPTLQMSYMVILGISKKRVATPFMTKHAGAK
jgi:hypothetical protein